jgi:hypothetical protein
MCPKVLEANLNCIKLVDETIKSLIKSRYTNLNEHKQKLISGVGLPTYIHTLLTEQGFWSSNSSSNDKNKDNTQSKDTSTATTTSSSINNNNNGAITTSTSRYNYLDIIRELTNTNLNNQSEKTCPSLKSLMTNDNISSNVHQHILNDAELDENTTPYDEQFFEHFMQSIIKNLINLF